MSEEQTNPVYETQYIDTRGSGKITLILILLALVSFFLFQYYLALGFFIVGLAILFLLTESFTLKMYEDKMRVYRKGNFVRDIEYFEVDSCRYSSNKTFGFASTTISVIYLKLKGQRKEIKTDNRRNPKQNHEIFEWLKARIAK